MVLSVSIGICAHNEGDSIGICLDSILAQKVTKGKIKEIIIVSSGSTDNTNKLVSDFGRKDPRIKLFIQDKKEGKASAVNILLSEASSDVLLLVSADVTLEEKSIENLLEPFANPSVGLVTARPVPDNDKNTFMGFTVSLIWRLHHHLQISQPKANEVFAMRPLVSRIDTDSAVDDLQIESLIRQKGYLTVYRPDAVVRNHGPETVRDLIKQRKRIITGYLHSRDSRHYTPITMDKLKVLSALLNNLSFNPKEFLWILAAVGLEVCIRMQANLDYYVFHKNPYNWEIAESTKRLTK